MQFDRYTNKIYISADELSRYAYQRENPEKLTSKYGFIKDNPNRIPPDFETKSTAVELEKEIVLGEHIVVVQGCADIISFDGILHSVEQIKYVNYFPRNLTPFYDPYNFAKAIICAYLYSADRSVPEIKTKITFIKESTEEKITYISKFTQVYLTRMFEALLDRAHVFIKHFADTSKLFTAEVEEMPFPYSSIRDGQEVFVKSAFRSIKRNESLLVSAPTGIGKTMSAIFPTIKAIGAGIVDKAFYITAKNITGKAALEACEKLSKYVPHLRAINITSKDQICPLGRGKYSQTGRVNCRHCDRTDRVTEDFGNTYVSYQEREISALSYLLNSGINVFTTRIISDAAEKFRVCPYELSLDLSERCMLIVCDSNYIIDDNIRFKRYFKNVTSTEKYVFLFDEAHNLPDRTRNTYSAVFSLAKIKELAVISENEFSGDTKFAEAVSKLISATVGVMELCKENEYFRSTADGEVVYGYYENSVVPLELTREMLNMTRFLAKYIREEVECYELLEPYYDIFSKCSFVASYFDDKFRFFAARENDELTIELLCIDPSGILETMLSSARSVIMFSATLSPIEYFREVMGIKGAEILELESPYEQNNLCLVAYDSVSTKLNDRRDTAYECAEAIVQTITQRLGNYIVYFPSYDYMKRVCKVFARIMPECPVAMQRQGMSFKERERFVNLFRERKHEAVVGFCVLGGMFSEGIDLSGESLIGAIIVGTGMPSLSAERNIMEAYYNDENGRGHEFAYTCPGMNKVLQAAGRVIRSESDRGVVVLIDDRYSEPGMKMLLPKHWRHIKFTGDLTSLSAILSDFWDKNAD